MSAEMNVQIAELLGATWEMRGEKHHLFAPTEMGELLAIEYKDLRKPMWYGRDLPSYSTDMGAAWRVHMHMCEQRFSKRLKYFAVLQEQAKMATGCPVAWPDVLVVLRDKMAEAICIAALTAQQWPATYSWDING